MPKIRIAQLSWLLVTLLTLSAFPTSARAEVVVSGTVRDKATLSPLAGIRVERFLYFGINGSYYLLESVFTDALGNYQMQGQPSAGAYTYLVAGGDGYVKALYPDRTCYVDSCPPYPPPGSALAFPATGIDFYTERTALISGTARRTSDGQPVTAGVVKLQNSLTPMRTTGVQPDGSFRFHDVVPGTYALAVAPASDELLEQLVPARDLDAFYTFDNAVQNLLTSVTTLPAGTAHVELSLNGSACFSGNVASTRAGGVPPDIAVSLKRLSPAGPPQFLPIGTATGGSYRIARLKPGTYRARFSHADRPDAYRANYFPDSDSESGSTAINLQPASCVSSVDATVDPRYSISGVVRDADSGAPLANVPVVAEYFPSIIPVPGINPTITRSDSLGRYVLQGFDVEDTKAARARPSRGHAGEAFLEQPYSGNAQSWDDVSVIDGQHRQGTDFTVASAPFITGRVVNLPAQSATIRLISGGVVYGTFPVEADGSYFTTGVETGVTVYRLELTVGNRMWVQPGIRCPTSSCDSVPGATAITLSEVREYPGFDFPLDDIFADGFQ